MSQQPERNESFRPMGTWPLSYYLQFGLTSMANDCRSVSLHICVVPWYLSRRDLSMGKRTWPQSWGKPTYFKYPSMILKISRDKGSLAVSDFKVEWSRVGERQDTKALQLSFEIFNRLTFPCCRMYIPCTLHRTRHSGSLLQHSLLCVRKSWTSQVASGVQCLGWESSCSATPFPQPLPDSLAVSHHIIWPLKHHTGEHLADQGKADKPLTEKRGKSLLVTSGLIRRSYCKL